MGPLWDGALERQQLGEGPLESPVRRRVPHGLLVMGEEPDKHFTDKAAANGSKTISGGSYVSFPEDVVPEWRLTVPSGAARANLVARERSLADRGPLVAVSRSWIARVV